MEENGSLHQLVADFEAAVFGRKVFEAIHAWAEHDKVEARLKDEIEKLYFRLHQLAFSDVVSQMKYFHSRRSQSGLGRVGERFGRELENQMLRWQTWNDKRMQIACPHKRARLYPMAAWRALLDENGRVL